MNNQITVIGHVGQAPVSRLFDDTNNKVVKFSVAVKEYSANKEEDKTLWIDVDVCVLRTKLGDENGPKWATKSAQSGRQKNEPNAYRVGMHS